jgi:hypothetical protein
MGCIQAGLTLGSAGLIKIEERMKTKERKKIQEIYLLIVA